MKADGRSLRKHAVVIGGSIAGMIAARILSDHFEKVTVFERDGSLEDAKPRPGVPHARHIHVLLKRGLEICEELFPGLRAGLMAEGCSEVRAGLDFRVLYPAGWNPEVDAGMALVPSTRILLEQTIRRLLTAPNVVWNAAHQVRGLFLDEGGDRIGGVRVRPWPATSGLGERRIEAGLVVDASGRNSELAKWMEGLGYQGPRQEIIDAQWGYATRVYRRSKNPASRKAVLVLGDPPHFGRIGVMQPIERDQWLITLAGAMGDHPGTQEGHFLEFARSLRAPLIYQLIRDAEPMMPVVGFRNTANIRNYYERLLDWPEGLLVMGDALCAFNPVYGQGMTVCALQGLAIQRALRETAGEPMQCKELLKRIAGAVDGPWTMATSEDLRWPETAGGVRDFPTRFMHWYLGRVLAAVPGNPDLFRRFQRVQQMVEKPTVLFRPSTAVKVLLGGKRRAIAAAPRLFEADAESAAREKRSYSAV